MDIKNISQQNFGASPFYKVNVFKFKRNTNSFERISAQVVEMAPEVSADVSAVSNVAKYWADKDTFACNINQTLLSMRKCTMDKSENKVLALLRKFIQNGKIDNEDVLALAHIQKEHDNVIRLQNIQVHPDLIYSRDREILGVGSAMLDSIKEALNLPIRVKSLRSKSVRNFYEKNGFELVDKEASEYLWTPKNKN